MNKEFNYEEWKENYYNNSYIDIINVLMQQDIDVANKLKINIKNKLYTENQLEILYIKLLKYYKEDDEDEIINMKKALDETGVKKSEFNLLLNKIYYLYSNI